MSGVYYICMRMRAGAIITTVLVAAVLILSVGWYLLGGPGVVQAPGSTSGGTTHPSQISPPEQVSSRTVSVTGTIVCLPHKGSGPSTMECAYGLQSSGGASTTLLAVCLTWLDMMAWMWVL